MMGMSSRVWSRIRTLDVDWNVDWYVARDENSDDRNKSRWRL